MISILIPVFNVQVHELVQELSNQLDKLSIPGEILVYDDYSEKDFKKKNSSISSVKHVFYKELEKNYGRVNIRRLLASDAHYNWLLFIDSDSKIISPFYLKNYIQILDDRYDVYAGGTVYNSSIPGDCTKRLHWKYGSTRETNSVKPVLHANNFCIRKGIFLELNFPPELNGYGHEDTWIHIKLEELNKKIYFLRNQVLHAGLEPAEIFLEKTKNALRNLLLLAEMEGKLVVKKKVSLYRFYLLHKKLGLTSLVKNILQKRIARIEKNLKSCNPSLFKFDLYRLYYLLLEEREIGHYKKG